MAPTMRTSWPRVSVILVTALVVLAPLGLVFYQSFLDNPFFTPKVQFTLSAYDYVLNDEDFHAAFLNSLMIATGMTAIAVPLGGVLAFLVVRTDLPGRRWLEPLLLLPVFLSPVVLAFGYVVAAGPVGFLSLPAEEWFGFVPWNIYSVTGLVLVAGLTHVPHVYLYASSALRGVSSDMEEAARISGAGPWRVALDVSLPMVMPALLYSGVLVFFLGFELFGLPLVLGDPQGILVMSTYLYKLTNLLGTPSYQLMAVVVVALVLVTFPLVMLQRGLLRQAGKYVTMKGKGARQTPLRLGGWKWLALGILALWLIATVVIPLAGIGLRSVVSSWGRGVTLMDQLTLAHYRDLWEYPNLVRGILNTLGVGIIGGAVSVGCYTAIALAAHRWPSLWVRVLDFLVLVPRAMPGLMAGLAILWIFLFVPGLGVLKSTMVSVWIAYTVVWLAYGMRLITTALLQVAPELEEGARVVGAGPYRVNRDITVPLIRFGMLGSWLLIFMIFVREYSTGIYLLGPGTEVIGSLLVSLWGTGDIDLISALSVINVAMVGAGLLAALRLGVRLHG
ncbi:ABC transporter permease [Azospirillum sp. sgz301742]